MARFIANSHIIWIIVISTSIRLFLAAALELGNDEVYYWTYALYPDLSHFDHPPMVGLVIKLFTLNGLLKDDFFMRLGPIVFSALNTWLIFVLVRKISDERAGLYAAILYNSSIYFSIISGFAIIPDAPLILFWLLSLTLIVDVLPAYKIDREARWKMILFGVYAGLAILSKYQGVFIWLGALLFIFIYNRKWLMDYSLYIAGLTSLIILSPIVLWNFQNDFITFSFHGERVAPAFGIRLDYLGRELLGQIAYQNPLNFIVFIPMGIALLKRESFMDPHLKWILILNGLPLWLTFTGFSLFRSTLPHWTGPSFLPVIMIAAMYWSSRFKEIGVTSRMLWPVRILLPSYFLIAVLALAVYLVNHSPFHFGKDDSVLMGENDFTQDMYGWREIGNSFRQIADEEEKRGKMPYNAGVISFRWFPGAHLDFYAAYPANRDLFLIGSLTDIHKYAWINEARGSLIKGRDYYYIAPSNYYRDPHKIFEHYFNRIEAIDTIKIERGGEIMRYAFMFRMKGYLGNFKTPMNLRVATNERANP